jgi:hypothetical protein
MMSCKAFGSNFLSDTEWRYFMIRNHKISTNQENEYMNYLLYLEQ